MTETNLAIARRWFEEVWNQRSREAIYEILTEDSICHTDDGPLRGPAEFLERQYIPFLAAFPDLTVKVESIVGQHDQVVVRWTASGTHTSEGLGIRPTHETTAFQGMTWLSIQHGKFLEGWQNSNIPEVLRGLRTKAGG